MKITYARGTIDPEEVVRFLGLIDPSENVLREMIRRKEVANKAKELALEVAPDQLQEFADDFRRSHGLEAAADLLDFLRRAGLSLEDFEAFCKTSVLARLLRDHLADENTIRRYYVNHPLEFDVARISVIFVKAEGLANEIKIRVTEDAEDFHALATRFSRDEETKYGGGHAGKVSRSMLPPEVATRLFQAAPGEVVGPFRVGEDFLLILVEEVIPAELDDQTTDAIKQKIFQQWESEFLLDGIRVSAS